MIHELLKNQRQYLDYYFCHLDQEKVEKTVELLEECKGTLLLSGVGKSGHIAQKITATLLSIGIKAFFLDPLHAVHGDLGFVDSKDLFLGWSKSGESQELIVLSSCVAQRGAKTVAVVSHSHSRLAKQSDFFISLPVEKELCPFNLAPTTSTAIQLLFGDCIAIALMEKKKVSLKQIAQNHPGGLIGRRISLKVADLMIPGDQVPFCRKSDLLIEVLHELSAKGCGCLLVVDSAQKLLGIFTDGDLRRALEKKGKQALEMQIGHLMSHSPKSTTPQILAMEAFQTMEKHPIMALPVVENEKVIGLVKMRDLLQAGLS